MPHCKGGQVTRDGGRARAFSDSAQVSLRGYLRACARHRAGLWASRARTRALDAPRRARAEQRARLAMLHPKRAPTADDAPRGPGGASPAVIFVLALGFAWIDLGHPGGARDRASTAFQGVGQGGPRGANQSGPKAAMPPAARTTADLVVLVSLDGLRPDVITPSMRALHKLYLQGASPHLARTIDKSATLPSHASMVSGVDPDQHGLDFNAYRPERGVIVEAHRVLGGARGRAADRRCSWARTSSSTCLARPTDAEFKMGGMLCEQAAQVRPAAPARGPQGPGVPALRRRGQRGPPRRLDDRRVHAGRAHGRSLSRAGHGHPGGCRHDSTARCCIVTSDHGGHNRGHGTRLDVDQHIPWYAWGAGVKRGRISRSVHTTDTAATVLAALGLSLPGGTHGQPVTEAFSRPLGPAGHADGGRAGRTP